MKTILFMLMLVMNVATAQQNIPIAPGVMDGTQPQHKVDARACIDAEQTVTQTIEDINAKMFQLETNHAEYYVRHSDRMSIISLIQHEMVLYTDQIHHAIFYGNANYCLDKQREAVKLASSIYQANLQYRKIEN